MLKIYVKVTHLLLEWFLVMFMLWLQRKREKKITIACTREKNTQDEIEMTTAAALTVIRIVHTLSAWDRIQLWLLNNNANYCTRRIRNLNYFTVCFARPSNKYALRALCRVCFFFSSFELLDLWKCQTSREKNGCCSYVWNAYDTRTTSRRWRKLLTLQRVRVNAVRDKSPKILSRFEWCWNEIWSVRLLLRTFYSIHRLYNQIILFSLNLQ